MVFVEFFSTRACSFSAKVPTKHLQFSGSMAARHYLVYLLSCLQGDSSKQYVGMTAVLRGQSDDAAKRVRKQFHLSDQRRWLKGMAPGSVRMTVLRTGLTLRNALIDEAREAARLYLELPEGDKIVRGGPWCRCRLPPEDAAEIAAIAACTSRQGVSALAASLPTGSLSFHLAGAVYPGTQQKRSLSAMQVLLPVKRPSGRSGRSGRSSTSGRSGHQYRMRAGIDYGTPRYQANKYGKDPKKARNKAQARFRAKRRSTGAL